MIDSTGKKITNPEQTVDLDFALAEIKFIMKGFCNSPDDAKALNIAQKVNDLLKADFDATKVLDIVEFLEKYSTVTKSDTFVWRLVYIRRRLSYWFLKNKDKKMSAESDYIAAKHFEKICDLNPSEHNLCCRIYSYVDATISFSRADMVYKNQEILAYAENLFIEIEDSPSSDYLKAGMYVYYNLYLDYKFVNVDSEKTFKSIKRAVRYAWRLYNFKNDLRHLDTLCRYYSAYSECEQFSLKREEKRLKKLVFYISQVPNKTVSLIIRESAFLTKLKKLEADKKAESNPQDTQ